MFRPSTTVRPANTHNDAELAETHDFHICGKPVHHKGRLARRNFLRIKEL